MKLKIGDILRDLKGKKCHVINVFEHEEQQIVVFKHWLKHKKRWALETQWTDLLFIGEEYGMKLDN